MKIKFKTQTAFLYLFFTFSGLSYAQQEINIKHQLGETKVELNPKKVVIFDVGTLETYHELGIPVAGVTNNIPDHIAEYKNDKYQKLGGIKEPNIQAIKALKPDLVIISGRQSAAYDSLSMIAPTIFLGVDTKNYWASFEENVQTIAKLHGKESLAEEKLAKLRTKRDVVKRQAKNDPNKALVLLHVKGGHTAYGNQARFGFPHDVLDIKVTPILADNNEASLRLKEGDGLPQKADPDYILLIDRDAATGGEAKPATELLSNDLKQTKAYQNGKIVSLPGNIWYISGGGLISVDQKITDIGEQLYNLSF